MRKMWSEYICEHPNVKTTRLKRKNKGPVISFSTFRNIFNAKLKDVLSFRKCRVDTCQVCDKLIPDLNVKIECLRWPEMPLTLGRSGTWYVALVTKLLSLYCEATLVEPCCKESSISVTNWQRYLFSS